MSDGPPAAWKVFGWPLAAIGDVIARARAGELRERAVLRPREAV